RRRAALAELLVREGPGRCADVLLSLTRLGPRPRSLTPPLRCCDRDHTHFVRLVDQGLPHPSATVLTNQAGQHDGVEERITDRVEPYNLYLKRFELHEDLHITLSNISNGRVRQLAQVPYPTGTGPQSSTRTRGDLPACSSTTSNRLAAASFLTARPLAFLEKREPSKTAPPMGIRSLPTCGSSSGDKCGTPR